jgi:hypothetical protein
MNGRLPIGRRALIDALAAAAMPAAAMIAADDDPLVKLEAGKRTVKSGDGANAREICLGDPAQLVRLEHAGLACTHESVAGDAAARPSNIPAPATVTAIRF